MPSHLDEGRRPLGAQCLLIFCFLFSWEEQKLTVHSKEWQYQNQRQYHIFLRQISAFLETWTPSHLDEGRRPLGAQCHLFFCFCSHEKNNNFYRKEWYIKTKGDITQIFKANFSIRSKSRRETWTPSHLDEGRRPLGAQCHLIFCFLFSWEEQQLLQKRMIPISKPIAISHKFSKQISAFLSKSHAETWTPSHLDEGRRPLGVQCHLIFCLLFSWEDQQLL